MNIRGSLGSCHLTERERETERERDKEGEERGERARGRKITADTASLSDKLYKVIGERGGEVGSERQRERERAENRDPILTRRSHVIDMLLHSFQEAFHLTNASRSQACQLQLECQNRPLSDAAS